MLKYRAFVFGYRLRGLGASCISIVLLAVLPLSVLIPRVGSTAATRTSGIVNFSSDVDWEVFDSDPSLGSANFLGDAQFVCLNAIFPSRCPVGSTLYGWPSSGWAADLTSIPRSNWIWAPNITGLTAPAEFNQFFFSRHFRLSGKPLSGSISIAVDDFAEVRVNGQLVGSTGSTTNVAAAISAQSSLRIFDLAPFLVTGINILTIRAENGAFGMCCPSSYSGNPAGVVFGGSITFQLS